MSLNATLYIRWSDKHQGQGSSEGRQQDSTTAFATKHGWTVISPPLIDDGHSGFSGANISKGALGAFEREILRDGGDGRALVVEKMDRLSRRDGFDVLQWVTRLVEAGLTFAIVNIDMVVDRISIREQKDQLRTIVDEVDQANAYARTLSQRVGAAWQSMRVGRDIYVDQPGRIVAVERASTWEDLWRIEVEERRKTTSYWVNVMDRDFAVDEPVAFKMRLGTLRTKVHTASTCPAWLVLEEDRNTFSVNTDVAAVVERIFRLSLTSGVREIAKILNGDGVATFRHGAAWRGSSVRALLNSRSVLGEYRYSVRGVETDDIDPNYFPAVIDLQLWQAVHDKRHRQIMSSHSRVSKTRHLIADVGRCATCGSKLTFVTKRTGPDNRFDTYAHCASAYLNSGCASRRSLRMIPVEDTILDNLLTLVLDDQHFTDEADASGIRAEIAVHRKSLEDADARLETLSYQMERPEFRNSSHLLTRFRTAGVDADAARAKLVDAESRLADALGAVSHDEHIRRVAEIRVDLWSTDEGVGEAARKLVKMAINDIVHSVTMDIETEQVAVLLRDNLAHYLMDWNGALVAKGETWRREARASDTAPVKDYFRRKRPWTA